MTLEEISAPGNLSSVNSIKFTPLFIVGGAPADNSERGGEDAGGGRDEEGEGRGVAGGQGEPTAPGPGKVHCDLTGTLLLKGL